MFESTLEAQALETRTQGAASLSAALVAHALVVTAAIAVSLVWIAPPPGPPPQIPVPAFLTVTPPHADDWRPPRPPEPPPPRGGGEAAPTAPVAPVAPVQPHATPSHPSAPEDTSWLSTPGPPGAGASDGVRGGTGLASISGGDGIRTGVGSGTGDPLELGEGIVPPVLLKRVEPDYPVVARIGRLEGHVEIEAVVGTGGAVESARIVSATNPIFDQSALRAVRAWRYRPALMNGRQVRVVFTVSIDFILR